MTISSLGLTDIDQQVLQVASKILAEENCRFMLSNNCDASVNIVIIDHDHLQSHDFLTQVNNEQITILYTNEDIKRKNLVALQKPVRVNTLKDVLLKAYLHLRAQQQYTNKARTSEENAAGNSMTSTANTENLFHLLLKTKQNRECLRINYPEQITLLINAVDRAAATNMDSANLHKLFDYPLENCDNHNISPETFNQQDPSFKLHTLDNLLWLAALHLSSGELLPGHCTDTPVRLKAWPNFTRQGFKPVYFKLATMLARKSMSLCELAEQTKTSITDVINFYNAAFAIDLIETNNAVSNMPKRKTMKNTNKSTLLDMLAKRLRIG